MTRPKDLDPVPLPIWWREEYGDPTREFDIDKMPAGREMDALIAELMGWKREEDGLYPWHMNPPRGQGIWYARIVPHYSTMIAPAWEVWEWAKRDGERWVKFVWGLSGALQGIHSLCRELTPDAICRAAWKARNHQTVKETP